MNSAEEIVQKHMKNVGTENRWRGVGTVVFIAIGVTLCAASLDIEVRSFKGPNDADGNPSWDMKVFSRGQKQILTERVNSKKNVITRSYPIKGSVTLSEIDENQDGAWDFLIFYGEDGGVIEGFERINKIVKPISGEKLAEWRRDAGKWKEYWDSALPSQEKN